MSGFEKLYNERKGRVETAIALGAPDRVPNVFSPGGLPYQYAGLTMAESMVDIERAGQAKVDFYKSFPTLDVGDVMESLPPAKTLELMGPKDTRWPGDPWGLDENNSYQFIEYPTLHDEEYDEFFSDPAGFSIRKLLPRVSEVFEPFADIDYLALAAKSNTNLFLSQRCIDSYKRMIAAAEAQVEKRTILLKYEKIIRDMGFYSIAGVGSATAFDMVSDHLRGTFGMMQDLILQRDNVKRAIELFLPRHIKHSLDSNHAIGSNYAWVMLHKGFDNFISDADYAELYWPSLRAWIYAMIDNGITPVIFSEGSYTTRLKYFTDLPKGKVIVHFEKVDLHEAKRLVGNVACIRGAFPTFTLTNGTKEQIIDKVKETLDVLAPGGGYLFTTGCAIDHCPRENLETLFEAVDKYGKY